MEHLAFDDKGLVPAVAQDRLTGQIRMLAWMSREAVERTLETGLATFFSRSRKSIWVKGEQSGHHLRVAEAYLDCDADVILLLVDPAGPSCHTGRPTCFFRRLTPEGRVVDTEGEADAFLGDLERVLTARQGATSGQSYTRTLLDAGAHRIGEKLTEEATELGVAIAEESDDRVANEAADLLYHLLVALRFRGLPLRRVLEALAARSGVSGLDEKASRRKA